MSDVRSAPRPHVRLLLPALAAVSLALAGCSDGSSGSTGPSDGGPATSPSSGTSSSEPTATFGLDGLKPGEPDLGTSRSTLGCRGPRHLLAFSQLTVDREVELRSVDVVGAQVSAGRAWITDDPDQTTSSGLLALGIPGPDQTDEPGWASREPLEGYLLEPGTVYTYFFELTLGPKGDQRAFTLGYAVGDDTAELDIPNRLSRRPC